MKYALLIMLCIGMYSCKNTYGSASKQGVVSYDGYATTRIGSIYFFTIDRHEYVKVSQGGLTHLESCQCRSNK